MFLVLSSREVVWAPNVVALIRSPGGAAVHLKDGGVLESPLAPASILKRSSELGLYPGKREGASHGKKEREQ